MQQQEDRLHHKGECLNMMYMICKPNCQGPVPQASQPARPRECTMAKALNIEDRKMSGWPKIMV